MILQRSYLYPMNGSSLSIYHAIIELLSDQADDKIQEMASGISLHALPRFAKNAKNAGFIMDLLVFHHGSKTQGIEGVISDCCDVFAENIYDILANYQTKSIFRGPLDDVMRQKLQTFHPIPNFQRIWNIQLEKDERWQRPAVGAWYNDEERYCFSRQTRSNLCRFKLW